jgi:Tfp pilus assembly protein FimT
MHTTGEYPLKRFGGVGGIEGGVLSQNQRAGEKCGHKSAQVGFMCKRKWISSCRGISLIEITILLGMMAVMAAFSIPTLTNAMHDMQLAADAKSIATTLTYARVKAGSDLARYRVSFVIGSNQWSLARWDPATSQYVTEQATNILSNEVSNSGITFKASSSTAPADFSTLTQSSTSITFSSRGIPIDDTGANNAGIIYLSSADIDFAISVSISGKVQLWRLQSGQWVLQ